PRARSKTPRSTVLRTQPRPPPVRRPPIPPFSSLSPFPFVFVIDIQFQIDREVGVGVDGRVGGGARTSRGTQRSGGRSGSGRGRGRRRDGRSSQLPLKPHNRPRVLLVDVLLRRADGRGAESALSRPPPRRLRPIPWQVRRHAHARAGLEAREEEEACWGGGEEGRVGVSWFERVRTRSMWSGWLGETTRWFASSVRCSRRRSASLLPPTPSFPRCCC
ncbi:hypothetical protein B0H13DRAFT_2018412, partial [Mycena leptocephala]